MYYISIMEKLINIVEELDEAGNVVDYRLDEIKPDKLEEKLEEKWNELQKKQDKSSMSLASEPGDLKLKKGFLKGKRLVVDEEKEEKEKKDKKKEKEMKEQKLINEDYFDASDELDDLMEEMYIGKGSNGKISNEKERNEKERKEKEGKEDKIVEIIESDHEKEKDQANDGKSESEENPLQDKSEQKERNQLIHPKEATEKPTETTEKVEKSIETIEEAEKPTKTVDQNPVNETDGLPQEKNKENVDIIRKKAERSIFIRPKRRLKPKGKPSSDEAQKTSVSKLEAKTTDKTSVSKESQENETEPKERMNLNKSSELKEESPKLNIKTPEPTQLEKQPKSNDKTSNQLNEDTNRPKTNEGSSKNLENRTSQSEQSGENSHSSTSEFPELPPGVPQIAPEDIYELRIDDSESEEPEETDLMANFDEEEMFQRVFPWLKNVKPEEQQEVEPEEEIKIEGVNLDETDESEEDFEIEVPQVSPEVLEMVKNNYGIDLSAGLKPKDQPTVEVVETVKEPTTQPGLLKSSLKKDAKKKKSVQFSSTLQVKNIEPIQETKETIQEVKEQTPQDNPDINKMYEEVFGEDYKKVQKLISENINKLGDQTGLKAPVVKDEEEPDKDEEVQFKDIVSDTIVENQIVDTNFTVNEESKNKTLTNQSNDIAYLTKQNTRANRKTRVSRFKQTLGQL